MSVEPGLSSHPGVLHLGLEESTKELLGRLFGKNELLEVQFDAMVITELQGGLEPRLVAVGPPPLGLAAIEVAQLLRMQFRSVPIFYLASVRQGFNKAQLKKNGFSDAFLLPFEVDVLETRLREEQFYPAGPKKKVYKAVKLIDLKPGVTLDFDTSIYLPANQKYIRISVAGDEIDAELLEKLHAHRVGAVYVEQGQMDKFYAFSANQLRKLGKSTDYTSATERTEKMRGAVREILAGVFNDSREASSFENGKALASECQGIVKHYITGSDASGDWYAKMLSSVVSGCDTHSHAANVATYSVLFALGMGLENAEEVGVAALLHDLGTADLPPELQVREEETLNEDERNAYYLHADYSVALINKRRVVVSERVLKAIAQHHERVDGSGYPHQLTDRKITLEAQILGLADEFDKLTTQSASHAALSPLDAIRKLSQCKAFDPRLVGQILRLFPI